MFKLPHVSTYKRCWLRRVMIVVTFPLEVAGVSYHLYRHAKVWWNWDGTTPPVAPAN